MVDTFKNLLLQSQKLDHLKTYHGASETLEIDLLVTWLIIDIKANSYTLNLDRSLFFKSTIVHVRNYFVVLYLSFMDKSIKRACPGHYDDTPMKYTATFHCCKNGNCRIKFAIFFSYFCSKHKLWVHVRTASVRQF